MILKSLLPTLSLLLLLLLSTHAKTTTPPIRTTSSFPFSNNTNNSSAAPAPTITPGPLHCDITYCVNGTSYCHFWAGVTTWQKTGPSPGELVTTLGVCKLGRPRTKTAV
ncbi:hypothetical protein MKX07_007520 [Trichoderma sp. CBMAI-0711]|uniref:SSCRP protein n=1 Tax=Trichoderma parareesei TaxID=858221 RepID=A0A2H2ZNC2_TRIPA|nr:hypothetical protein MKX07_007520 [Trichoderma sp. CBMAI-0711]OTA04670.1 hypothetical protein A9Z42_0052660 [Trichoderma parareesei]